jgi:protein phosphatase
MDGEPPVAIDPAPAERGVRLCASVAMLSHVGCVREANEDYVLYSAPEDGAPDAAFGALAVVADGMGGHAAGEVASRMAALTVHGEFYQEARPVPAALAEGFAAANRAIHEQAKADPQCAGMGTTCTAVAVRDDCIWLGHVGDSRAYLIRKKKLYRISEDHSLVAELVRRGSLTESEAKTFPDRNVILRALGIEPTVEPTVWREGLPAKPGDVVVICSDGLSDVVEEDAIRDIAGSRTPFEACEALIQSALSANASDNVSVGVIAIEKAARRGQKVGRSTAQIAPKVPR